MAKNKDATIKVKKMDPSIFVKSPLFLNGAHMILGPTRSGKTTLCALLLYVMCQNNIGGCSMNIIILATTQSVKDYINKMKVALSLDMDVVTVSDMTALFDLYIDIGNRNKNRKSEVPVDTQQATPNATGESTTQPSTPPQQMPPPKYIFIFDDCMSMITNKSNLPFFTEFCSNHRQFNITAIYNVQQYLHSPTILRDNLFSLSIVGSHNKSTLTAIFTGSVGVNNIFDEYSNFAYFMQHQNTIFTNKAERLIISFRQQDDLLYTYVVPKVCDGIVETPNSI